MHKVHIDAASLCCTRCRDLRSCRSVEASARCRYTSQNAALLPWRYPWELVLVLGLLRNKPLKAASAFLAGARDEDDDEVIEVLEEGRWLQPRLIVELQFGVSCGILESALAGQEVYAVEIVELTEENRVSQAEKPLAEDHARVE